MVLALKIRKQWIFGSYVSLLIEADKNIHPVGFP